MKSYKLNTIVALGCLIVLWTPTELAAVKVPSSKAELEKVATHIVLGKVEAIYSRKERKKMDGYPYDFTYYIAEVKVDRFEKGKGPSDLMYIRYFDLRWAGKGIAPPGPGGHDGVFVGKTYRFYASRNAYDGFHPKAENNDGGYNLVYVNGAQPLDGTQPVPVQPFDPSPVPFQPFESDGPTGTGSTPGEGGNLDQSDKD